MSINLLEERHIFHRQLTDSHTLGRCDQIVLKMRDPRHSILLGIERAAPRTSWS